MRLNFKFLTGDMNWQEYGGKFVSKKLNNGEFDYWLVMDVINWHEHEPCYEYTYNVSVQAISPELNTDLVAQLIEDYGYQLLAEDEPLLPVEMLASYGCSATLWNENGNNLRELMKQAREEAAKIEFLFGLYMDKAQNAVGSTGWDVIQGDLLAGLRQ
jgi:hypothetical protein